MNYSLTGLIVPIGFLYQGDMQIGDREATPEEIAAYMLSQAENEYKQKIQDHLDAKAKLKGYDNILSACSYASVPNDFQAESQAFVVWRASVWSYGYTQLSLIKSGGRALPSIEEFIAELPKFEG
ncbi:MAG: hypothetical protein QMB85_08430 [Sulfurospirillum sp.]